MVSLRNDCKKGGLSAHLKAKESVIICLIDLSVSLSFTSTLQKYS